MDVRGKAVLITGASEGIGAACAEAFRRRGALLALNARSEEKLRAVAGAGDLIVPGDITDSGARERVVEATLQRFERIDVLINNAGAGLYWPAWRAPEPETRHLFELNLFAPLGLIQLVVPHMRRERSGIIVNISSIAGKVTLPWFTLYSVSKYALCSLSDGIRMELSRDGIHVMTVCPGYVSTKFQQHILAGSVPPSIARSRRFTISAEQCAEAIARGVEQNKRTVVVPASGWALIALARLFPRLLDAQLARLARRSEGAAG